MLKHSSQSGIGLVSVLVVVTALLGSIYYMHDKVDLTSKLVLDIQNKSKNSYAMKGIVAYAKDLISSRVCINTADETGLPVSPCKLTDSGSLERLLISRSVADSLCTFYVNNGKPNDGLQNYCEANKPPLYLTTFNFNIKSQKISAQHPLYVLFDKTSDYSLYKANCINIKYDSTSSSLHSSISKATTTVTAYEKDDCTGKILSTGQSIDMFYPRQISEFTLITNRSLSIGKSLDLNANIISEDANVIFQSPIFINKDFYIPESGSASTRKVTFQDRVFLTGELRNQSLNYLQPLLVDSGDLWLSRLPAFEGIQKGIVRTNAENSLTRLFSPTLAPANIDLMTQCNDYRTRKSGNNFCTIKPKLLIKKMAANKYTLGLEKQSEFVPYKVGNPSEYNGLIDYPSSKPSRAKLVLRFDDNGNSNELLYLSPESTNGIVAIDLVKLNKLVLLNDVSCLTLTNPNRKMCKDNSDNLTQITPVNNAYSSQTVKIVMGSDSESYVFSNNDNRFTSKTIDNCAVPPAAIANATSTSAAALIANNALIAAQAALVSATAASNAAPSNNALLTAKNDAQQDVSDATIAAASAQNTANTAAAQALISQCDLTTNQYNTTKAPFAAPKLKLIISPRLTLSGTAAPQVFDIEINTEAFDPAIFEFKNSNILKFSMKPLDFCASGQFFEPNVMIDLSNNSFPAITSSAWSYVNGSVATLTSTEATYLDASFSYLEKCNAVSLPSTSYASYDADWTLEAFNSWNFNPIDKAGQYKANPLQVGYATIFNLAIPITNKLVIDASNSTADSFHNYSILDRCIIKSSASQVKGFLGCRYMVIETRTTDLEMIGTFIVDKMEIGSLGTSKIFWKNIYHPSIRDKLVGAKQLKTKAQCLVTAAKPAWASMDNECLTSSLTMKAVPFTWTTFDPLCVISASSPVAICKPEERSYNFNTVKIFEVYGI